MGMLCRHMESQDHRLCADWDEQACGCPPSRETDEKGRVEKEIQTLRHHDLRRMPIRGGGRRTRGGTAQEEGNLETAVLGMQRDRRALREGWWSAV